MLKITSEGRKAALDMRLVRPALGWSGFGRFGFGHATTLMEVTVDSLRSDFLVAAPELDLRLIDRDECEDGSTESLLEPETGNAHDTTPELANTQR